MMSVRRLSVPMLVMLAVMLAAGTAFAQTGKRKQADSHIGVAKNLNNFEDAQYTSIQAAVNAAKAGQTIEILDTEVYDGQVTIDGRETSPWTAVTGGSKHGLRIRYVPPSGTAPNSNFARPTIRYRDTQNTSPTSVQQAKTDGELPGSGGNFETCGALRIIRAEGVVIDGIAVDGVSAYPFGASGVWCDQNGQNCSNLFHGSAAITLVVAGGAVIRNCDIKNAYFGINVKDRNTGGVFGNPNPADNDNTVPLSTFGTVGGHLIEYNRIHNNSVGMFFESAWDLGSSVRYNLIYNNNHTTTTSGLITIDKNNQSAGAFLFKDMYLSPVAIYNNTLYNNTGNFLGNWKMGGQHLIFNNIFSKSDPEKNPSPYMVIDALFPNRMHNCVFSANVQIQTQQQSNFNCDNALAPGGAYVNDVRLQGFANPEKSRVNLKICNNGVPTNPPQTQGVDMTQPGARILGAQQNTIPRFPTTGDNVANVRWLQTEGYNAGGVSLAALFQSVDETNANFLVPKWDHPDVIEYIKNKGWTNIGVRNADGTLADLGAFPSSGGQQKTVGRLKPSNVVLVSGGTRADASVFFSVEGGATFSNPKIKYLRWVAPIPVQTESSWANDFTIVPASSLQRITNPPPTVLSVGNNQFTFTLPSALAGSSQYGFFEIVVEGTDANGNTVVSDVGFLPYRQLEYFLDVEFYNGTTKVTSVKAGDQITMRVTARRGTSPFSTGPLNELTFRLQSAADAFVYSPGGAELTSVKNATTPISNHTVYFTKAGKESVMGTGLYESGSQRLVFLGVGDITVLPADPKKLVFVNPIPKSQVGENGIPPVINRGLPLDVLVEVRDMYDNPVGAGQTVGIVSNYPDRGNVVSPTATTGADGVARFVANVTNGETNDRFELTASMTGVTPDVALLRIGRVMDRLLVFYGNVGGGTAWAADWEANADSAIIGTIGEWKKVVVKAVSPDAVLTTQGGFVLVEPDNPLLIFASNPDGTGQGTIFPVTNGVATFYVGSLPSDVNVMGGITVTLLRSNDPGDRNNAISPGQRGEITFEKRIEGIIDAMVYGDGNGRPLRVDIRYDGSGATFASGLTKPDSVSLTWARGEEALITAAVTVLDSVTIRASFVNAAGASLFTTTGYTDISGDGRNLVMVYGGSATDDGVNAAFPVYEAIGPVIAAGGEQIAGRNSPIIMENLDPANVLDTIIIQLSEPLRGGAAESFVGATSIVYSETGGDPATGGTPLEVESAFLDVNSGANAYRLVLARGATRPQGGGWIRFNGANESIKDMAGQQGPSDNGVHVNNRWVQLIKKEVPPSVEAAWYTSDPITGIQDFVYLTFNKKVDLAWFTGGYFTFGAGRTDSSAVGNYLSIKSDDSMTVVVNLRLAWPGQDRSKVVTSGMLPVRVGTNPVQGWDVMPAQAADRAAPVLVSAKLIKGAPKGGGDYYQDTLEIVYSEPPSAAARQITQPVVICRGTSKAPIIPIPTLLDLGRGAGVSGTSYFKVMYLVEDGRTNELLQNDSVYINWDGVPLASQMSDGETPPNYQGVENRNVPLTIESKISWDRYVKNNPFFFTTGDNNNRGATVVVSPGANGVTFQEVKAKIRLYDNIGNLIIDTTVVSPTADSIVWNWSGHNSKGRMVGTGTYLFKAICDVTEKGETSPASTERIVERIGFVRRK